MAEPTPDLEPSPCPFCGGENIALGMNRNNVWCVCVRCDATGPIAPHGPDDDPANAMRPAIDAWNRRSPLVAAAPALREALVGLLPFARGTKIPGPAMSDPWISSFDACNRADAALAQARPPEAR